MLKPILRVSVLFVLSILLSIQGSTSFEQENRIQSIQTQFSNQEAYQNLDLSPDFGKIPLYFVPNRGQVDETALFYAKTSRYTLWLTEEGLVFDSTRRIKKESTESIRQNPRDINNPEDVKYDRDVSRLVFVKANRSPEVITVEATEHKVNYLIGNDKSEWRSNIQTSRAVLYKELYPNIDLKVYGMENQIEYDFVVKPGGEVSDIGFGYKDVEKTRIDKEGNLAIKTKFGEIKHAKPACYQVIEGERVEIRAEFKRKEDNTYGFQVKEYNKNYELIIDPLVLVYSTFLGGSGADSGRSIAVDSTGSIYVAGFTSSTRDFPTKNSIQGSYAGGTDDAFITKINASGTDLVYSTYLGGSGDEGRCETGIAVDSEGAVYVAGWTDSDDFPTKNPIQGSNAGGIQDGFITKINASGSTIVYSTYLGGSSWDQISGIAVDSEGAAYVAGCTLSDDFPTKNPIQGSYAGTYDVFITKINPTGNELIYSTYLSGSGVDGSYGMAIDSEGAVYLTGYTNSTDFPTQNPIQGTNAGGYDAFITKINASGTALVYSTYLGGSGEDWYGGIAVDSGGAAYVTGSTGSIDFPTKNPIQGSKAGERDAFITKINASGTALVYSTYLGGSGGAGGVEIAVDSEGAAYVAGGAGVDFPTKNPIQGINAGETDIFIAKVNSSGSDLIYSTYLGGRGEENSEGLAVDSEGAAYVTGFTRTDDFPALNPIQGSYGGGERDAIIAKLSFTSSTPTTYSLTITAGSGGTTDPLPGTYTHDEGTVVTIRAIPNSGYTFSGWSGDASGTTNPITIALDSDKSITANFTETTTYTLTITAGSGGTTDPLPGTYTHDEGTVVTIRAIPNSGYTFSGWSGDASGTTNPITVTMDSDKSITASFAKVSSDDDGGGDGGGCFIATACYGTSMAEEVKTLSAFRDRYLITNPTGEAMVKFYKTHSPRVADFIRDKEDLKIIIRACLKPIIWIISKVLE